MDYTELKTTVGVTEYIKKLLVLKWEVLKPGKDILRNFREQVECIIYEYIITLLHLELCL